MSKASSPLQNQVHRRMVVQMQVVFVTTVFLVTAIVTVVNVTAPPTDSSIG